MTIELNHRMIIRNLSKKLTVLDSNNTYSVEDSFNKLKQIIPDIKLANYEILVHNHHVFCKRSKKHVTQILVNIGTASESEYVNLKYTNCTLSIHFALESTYIICNNFSSLLDLLNFLDGML